MKEYIRSNWWIYFFITYLISWSIWAAGFNFMPDYLITATTILGAFGPMVSALILLKLSDDKYELKSWMNSRFNIKINYIWYLLGGIIIPISIAIIHHLIYLMLGGKSGIVISTEWFGYFIFLITTSLLSGGNEEPGWRGYITPILMNKYNPIIANVIVGIFWALWHIPLYLQNGWSGSQQPLIWLILYAVPLSIILTWLFYKSRLSIVPVMLLHAGTNVVFKYFPMQSRVFNSIEDEFTIIKTIVYWLIAIVIIIFTKGKINDSQFYFRFSISCVHLNISSSSCVNIFNYA